MILAYKVVADVHPGDQVSVWVGTIAVGWDIGLLSGKGRVDDRAEESVLLRDVTFVVDLDGGNAWAEGTYVEKDQIKPFDLTTKVTWHFGDPHFTQAASGEDVIKVPEAYFLARGAWI